ncbi:hypothetical protein ACVWZR_007678 [Bradyrhizobium sp. i1.3.1]
MKVIPSLPIISRAVGHGPRLSRQREQSNMVRIKIEVCIH